MNANGGVYLHGKRLLGAGALLLLGFMLADLALFFRWAVLKERSAVCQQLLIELNLKHKDINDQISLVEAPISPVRIRALPLNHLRQIAYPNGCNTLQQLKSDNPHGIAWPGAL